MKSMLLLALLGLQATLTSAQMSYYFTSSNNIKVGQPYEVQLNIHRPLPEPLVVQVSLTQNNSYPYEESHKYYYPPTMVDQKTVKITEQGATTVTLMIPQGEDSSSMWYVRTSLEVNCTGAFEAYHSARLDVERSSISLYVQSDKAMYKPGDKVRFRTFATHPDLKPYLGKFNISIRDPEKSIMRIWRNVLPDSAVASNQFNLSTQPILGSWVIKVETEMGVEKEFRFVVEEYVLPKFKVSVEMPPFILSVSKEFSAVVEVKYTFGKPVQGNVSIAVGMRADGYQCRNAWEENRYSYREVHVCNRKRILAELNKDGKYDIKIPISDMVSLLPYTVCNYRGKECEVQPRHLHYKTFFVWVNATEAATGVTLSGEGQLSFSPNPVMTQFLPATPNNYKPGLPFIGYIQVKQPDGSPVPEPDLMQGDGLKRAVNLTIRRNCPYVPKPRDPREDQLPPSPPLGGRGGTPGIASSSIASSSSASNISSPELRPLKEMTTEAMEADHSDAEMTTSDAEMTTSDAEMTTSEAPLTKPPCVPVSDSKMIEVSPGGIMAFEVPVISAEFESIQLRAEFVDKYNKTSSVTKYVQPFETKSDKALRVLTEMEEGALKPGSTAQFEVTAGEEIERLRIDIIAKGSIVYSMDKVYDIPSMTQTFSLDIDDDFARLLAPTPRIVVWYVREDGEIIADSVSFSVDSELANQVKVDFSRNQTKPDEDVQVTVEAYKGSTVGLLVVDQSVKLLAIGNEVTKEMIEADQRRYNPNTPFYPALWARGGRYGGMCCGCWPYQMSGSDTTELFRSSGYLIFTDGLVYKKPQPTYSFFERGPRGQRGPMFESAPGGRAGRAGMAGLAPPMPASTANSAGLQPVENIRTEFPETWLWIDEVMGPDGRMVHQAKAPDTITSWIASAFALSKEKGLGVSSQAKMTVFKPFFVTLTLPYALIRGEQFAMKATVFNYLTSPQDVTVTLQKSIYYNVLVNDQEVSRTARQSVKVPANGAQTVAFWIIPTKVGLMNVTVIAQSSQASDGLRRILPVRPEGTPQEHTESMLISLAKGSSPFIKVLQPKFPPKDLVEDSQRVKVTVVGDIMGTMMNNLGSLVKMPYGCGEQNMVNFVPNIQVIRYIDAAGMNKPQLRDQAVQYMEIGYQRELTYKRNDGSFSAFGSRDAYGSTWLTAFVLKSFAQAVPYMEVNEKHIVDAVQFLLRMQNRDGSFSQPGRTASYLAGGSGTHANMAAYIAIALATARDANYTDVVLKNKISKMVAIPLAQTISFLESNMTGIESDPYSMAITTYAYSLIGNPKAEAALSKLNSMGRERNGMRYWAVEEEEEEDISRPWWYYRWTRSYDIEMTAYAMLSNLMHGSPEEVLPSIKWITSKQNAYGGYRSTQDTVMALQALTQFSTDTIHASAKQKLYVRVSADISDMEFDPITPENSMVMQVGELSRQVNSLTVMGSGSGNAMVQMVINYNIRDPDIPKELEVKVDSMEDISSGKVMVDVCFQWLKKGEESGMGILEITPLSGFEINTKTLLDNNKDIRRTEKDGQTLVTYWDKFEEKLTCLNISLYKLVDVANIQPAEVKLYAYYEPGASQTVLYIPSNMKSVDRCQSCPACCQKDGIQVLERISVDDTPKGKNQEDRHPMKKPDNANTNRDKSNSREKAARGDSSTTTASFCLLIIAVLSCFVEM